MKSRIIAICCMATMLGSCANEFNRVYRTSDLDYKYEYAKECFACGKFSQATTLLQELVTPLKASDNAEESLYMLGMSEYCGGDFGSAAETFKKYHTSYPRGIFAEQALYHVGRSLYESTPEPRLDQSATISAINAYQTFLDYFPDSKLRLEAQKNMFELQDKLVLKEYLSAELYYNLGGYFGNCTNGGSNYEACIVTAQNAIKAYPYTSMREDFSLLIAKSKYELACQSVEEKKVERFRDAEDECYGFLNEFPESKDKEAVEKFIANCKKYTKN